MPGDDEERSIWEREEARPSWEREEEREERSELHKMLQMQLDILRESPELAAQMVALQRHVVTQDSQQDVSHHICPVCCHKRYFVAMVQTFATVLALRTGEDAYLGALMCALRTPATRLQGQSVFEAAWNLVRWYADEALPEEQRTVPQPEWYSKAGTEWDGHE